jgi:suppressor for copper-sensitivity B
VATLTTAQIGAPQKADMVVDLDRTAYEPGETATLVVTMMIEHGWHTNSNQPSYEYLIPTEINITPPDGWEAASFEYPQGELKSFAFAEERISVYESEISMLARQPIAMTAAEGAHALEVALTFQACDDRSCLAPMTIRSSIELMVGAGGEVLIDAPTVASATLPEMAAASTGAAGSGSTRSGPSLALMLLLGLIGGLILNAMPCVLPVLSLKVFGLVKSAGQGKSEVVKGSLATSAGILFSFWALALAAVVARAGGAAVGWGVQFQEPTFVAALTLVVVLFCLNLWGLFEVPLPAAIANAAGGSQRGGMAGHFTSGLFATLMATPCSAPFLGTAIGFALAQEASTIFAIFTAVGLGMALPYLALAAAPRAANLLPRPGAWMNHLRVVMGFLLAGAAIWLLYVLSAQISPERLAFFQAALLLLSLFVWWHSTASKPGWSSRLAMLAVLATVVLAVGLAWTAPAGAGRSGADAQQLIEWTEFDRAAAESLAGTGQMVFVDVTADWCFTCKVNERLALETESVANAFATFGVVAMKADWTNRSDAIATFLSDHGRYGIPFYLLYRPGQEPHIFGELITSDEIVEMVTLTAESIGDVQLTEF